MSAVTPPSPIPAPSARGQARSRAGGLGRVEHKMGGSESETVVKQAEMEAPQRTLRQREEKLQKWEDPFTHQEEKMEPIEQGMPKSVADVS